MNDLVEGSAHGVPDLAHCWLIADTHFFHENIRGYTGRPDDADERIVQHWRERVGPEDTVIHLGDLAFGHPDRLRDLLATLPGHLLLLSGNHDRQTQETYRRLDIKLIPPCTLLLENWNLVLTHAPHPELIVHDQPLLNIHGHIHEKLAPDLYMVNVGVEWTGYAPLRLIEVAQSRIKTLSSPGKISVFDPPMNYAEWLAATYGGAAQRSDVTRLADPDARSVARETYTAYRHAVLESALV